MEYQKPDKKNLFKHLLRNIQDSNNGIKIMLKESSTVHRIYPIMLIASIVLGITTKFNVLEIVIIVFLFLLDFIIETMNSAVEEVADRITLKRDEKIKRTKDIASAAVYITHLLVAFAILFFAISHLIRFSWWTHLIPV
ncbi:diacylglycerol kinase [Candidatus Saccharibacteria bacterium]|nr:diacylglycerol kinase [Candidatus Saccharibacteria bacterium]